MKRELPIRVERPLFRTVGSSLVEELGDTDGTFTESPLA